MDVVRRYRVRWRRPYSALGPSAHERSDVIDAYTAMDAITQLLVREDHDVRVLSVEPCDAPDAPRSRSDTDDRKDP